MVGLVAHGHDRGHKEARAQQHIQRHHDRAHKECRKGKQRKNGGNKNAPHSERHAHQGHAPGSRLKNRDHVVQAAHRKANDENRQRSQHQQDACLRSRGARQNRLRWIEGPPCPGRASPHEEACRQEDDRCEVHPEANHV